MTYNLERREYFLVGCSKNELGTLSVGNNYNGMSISYYAIIKKRVFHIMQRGHLNIMQSSQVFGFLNWRRGRYPQSTIMSCHATCAYIRQPFPAGAVGPPILDHRPDKVNCSLNDHLLTMQRLVVAVSISAAKLPSAHQAITCCSSGWWPAWCVWIDDGLTAFPPCLGMAHNNPSCQLAMQASLFNYQCSMEPKIDRLMTMVCLVISKSH